MGDSGSHEKACLPSAAVKDALPGVIVMCNMARKSLNRGMLPCCLHWIGSGRLSSVSTTYCDGREREEPPKAVHESSPANVRCPRAVPFRLQVFGKRWLVPNRDIFIALYFYPDNPGAPRSRKCGER